MQMYNRLSLPIRLTLAVAVIFLIYFFLTMSQVLRNYFFANIELVTWTRVMFSDTPANDAAWPFGRRDFTMPPGFAPELLLELSPEQQTPGDIDAIASRDRTGEQTLSLAIFFENLGLKERANGWWAHIEQNYICTFSLWYYRGRRAETEGAWEEAIANYEKAATFPITPCDHFGHSDGLYRVGVLWQDRPTPPELENAVSAHRRAADIDDFKSGLNRVENYYRLGQSLFALSSGNAAESVEALSKAVEMRPTHSWTNLVLGRAIYSMNSDFELAEHYMQRAYEINLGSNWQFPFYLGKLYEAEGLLEEAREYYLRAQERSPNHPRVIAAMDAMNSGR